MTTPTPDDLEARAAAFVPPPPRTGGRWGHVAVLVVTIVLGAVWGPVGLSPWWTPPAAFVPVLVLLPVLAVVLLVAAFAVWTAAPDHPGAPWAVALATLAPLAWWGPAWTASPGPDVGTPLRVMTWNVRRLWGAPGAEAPAGGCVADVVTAEDPGVVVLQEVTRADLDDLAARVDLDCAWSAYRPTDPDTAAGLAVCARGAWALASGGPGGDAWRHVAATIRQGEHHVEVVGVHAPPWLLLDDPARRLPGVVGRLGEVTARQRAQAEELTRLGRDSDVTVLAGDFNSSPDLPQHTWLRGTWTDAWRAGARGFGATVAVAGWLPVRIDYVYVAPDVSVRAAWVPDTACSDHLPVVTDLRLPP